MRESEVDPDRRTAAPWRTTSPTGAPLRIPHGQVGPDGLQFRATGQGEKTQHAADDQREFDSQARRHRQVRVLRLSGHLREQGRQGALDAGRMKRKRRTIVEAESNCKSFVAGHNSPSAATSRRRKRKIVRHHVDRPQSHRAVGLRNGHAGGVRLQNKFECIPDSVTFRPARLTPQRSCGACRRRSSRSAGRNLARQVRPGQGQFYWDREENRTRTPRAGFASHQPMPARLGLDVHPRIGQRWSSIFSGDPDRPLITGVVCNAEQMPLRAPRKTKSYLKNNSSPGGGLASCVLKTGRPGADLPARPAPRRGSGRFDGERGRRPALIVGDREDVANPATSTRWSIATSTSRCIATRSTSAAT